MQRSLTALRSMAVGQVAMEYPISMGMEPDVEAFFDEATNTVSYVATAPDSPACAVIDSVLDLDDAAGRIVHESADKIV